MADNRYPVERLRGFGTAMLEKIGASKADAAVVADTLLCADLRGIHSHGIGKLKDYITRVEAGVLNPNAPMVVERDNAVTAVLDAANGFGQVAAHRAMSLAMEKAKTAGLGMVLCRHSNHFGIASYYSMMAAGQGLIGVTATNASPGIAPFGAKEKLFGTNPLAVAVPSGHPFPVVLDMSSSVVARGKLRQAMLAGTEIPLGWARDKDGTPTTDPEAGIRGTLEPISGPKGAGLALMIELLCGVLPGACLPGEVRVVTDTGGPCGTGHLFYAADPGCFTHREEFLARVDEAIRRIKALTPIGDEVCVPGELEWRSSQAALRDGIALKPGAEKILTELSQRYSVPL